MSIHNAVTGEQCRHCDEGNLFVRWEFTVWHDGRAPKADVRSVAVDGWTIHSLIARKCLAVAAEDMRASDVMHQFNEVNGGEGWLTLDGEPAPWICRRLEPNSDGTEPQLWAFYVADEIEARSWLESGQVDAIEQAIR